MSRAMEVWGQDLATTSEGTQWNYRHYFAMFLERYGIGDGEDLYEMRRVDLESGDSRDHKRVERMAKVFMAEMLADDYAAGTCGMVSKALVSFFDSQDLPFKIRAKDKPKGFENGSRVALGDQIRSMWDFAPASTRVKTRAQLMFLKDAGIRVSDLATLDIADYLESRVLEVDDDVFRVFEVRGTEKTKAPAYIHIGPEAVMAVNRYLEERGEEDPGSPLFVDRFGKRFRAKTITLVFYRLGGKVGKKISGHSLRKFHRTRLEGAGMPESWVKKLQGKKASVYSQPEHTGELTQRYIDCYDALRIFGEEASAQKMAEQAARIRQLEEDKEHRDHEMDGRLAEQKKEIMADIAEMIKRVSPPPQVP